MRKLKGGTWFGFAEVDIEIPEALWPKFVLHQQRGARGGGAGTHAEIRETNQRDPREREKVDGRVVRGENVGGRPPAAVVRGPPGGDHNRSSENKLPTKKYLSLVCGAGDSGKADGGC